MIEWAKIAVLLLAGAGALGIGGVIFILALVAWNEWTSLRKNRKRSEK
jgi:hypothetical protein